jgi:hypothetical protein
MHIETKGVHSMKRLVALLAIAGVLGVTPVLSQTAEPAPEAPASATGAADQMVERGPGHKRGHKGGSKHRFIDANLDGIISDEEAASLADHAFARLDRDRNASLTEAEFTAPRGRERGWFNWGSSEEAAAVLKVRQEKFASLDADKNGQVSKAEFFAEAKARLAAADADKDGKVSPWEYRAAN